MRDFLAGASWRRSLLLPINTWLAYERRVLFREAARSLGRRRRARFVVHSCCGVTSPRGGIDSNQAALAVAKGYAQTLDFMVYAYLQGAQDAEAKRGVGRNAELQKSQAAVSNANPTGAVLAGYTALAAITARYAIER